MVTDTLDHSEFSDWKTIAASWFGWNPFSSALKDTSGGLGTHQFKLQTVNRTSTQLWTPPQEISNRITEGTPKKFVAKVPFISFNGLVVSGVSCFPHFSWGPGFNLSRTNFPWKGGIWTNRHVPWRVYCTIFLALRLKKNNKNHTKTHQKIQVTFQSCLCVNLKSIQIHSTHLVVDRLVRLNSNHQLILWLLLSKDMSKPENQLEILQKTHDALDLKPHPGCQSGRNTAGLYV